MIFLNVWVLLFQIIKVASQETTAGDYELVSQDVVAALDNPGFDDGSLGPIIVRLAWHSSGTFDLNSNTGGPNGATMRFAPELTDPANGGMENARNALQPIKDKHSWITFADLWTMAGARAIEALGGPRVSWTPGRTDLDAANVTESEIPPNGRLPDGSQGASHVRQVFSRMGFSDQETVALCGAHSLGRCHRDNSGWDGSWTHTPRTFSNQYFKLLLNTNWTETTLDTGRVQFIDPDNTIMMLPTDMAFLLDDQFNPFVETYAADEALFFTDFARAYAKLLEHGVTRENLVTPRRSNLGATSAETPNVPPPVETPDVPPPVETLNAPPPVETPDVPPPVVTLNAPPPVETPDVPSPVETPTPGVPVVPGY